MVVQNAYFKFLDGVMSRNAGERFRITQGDSEKATGQEGQAKKTGKIDQIASQFQSHLCLNKLQSCFIVYFT